MCLLFLYLNNSAHETGYKIIIANQRDEYYTRPTQPAAFWPDAQHCISGLDMEPNAGNGTWFGVSSQGKIATLLNILHDKTGDVAQQQRTYLSRGGLVRNFLTTQVSSSSYMHEICENADKYRKFNLVLMEESNGIWDIQYTSSESKVVTSLKDGFHGFGNSVIKLPFTKVCNGTPRFQQIIEQHSDTNDRELMSEKLLDLMADAQTVNLPDEEMKSLGGQWLEGKYLGQLARIFVNMPERKYGTRTTTLFTVDGSNNCEYIEKTMREPIDINNIIWDTTKHKFKMSGSVNSNL